MIVLEFRGIGAAGRYPGWLRLLREASGAYVIRRAADRRIVYVGESHSDRLYATITRHFQTWRRLNGYRRDTPNDPGVWYPRAESEVAVVVTDPDAARPLQDDLIRRLEPEDNVIGHPGAGVEREPGVDDDDVPPPSWARAPADVDDAVPF